MNEKESLRRLVGKRDDVAKRLKKPVRGEKAVEEIVCRLSIEFGASRRDILGGGQRGENFVRLMAIVLARELSGLDIRRIDRVFGASASERGGVGPPSSIKIFAACARLEKKIRKTEEAITKKVGGF